MDYVSPPIVEAVVQVNFAELVDLGEIVRFADRLPKEFSSRNDRFDISAQVEVASGEMKTDIKKVGLELRDVEGGRVAVVQQNYVIFSQLAPYPGWEKFSEWIIDLIGRLQQIVGSRKLSRVGMRFVNRVDVPFTDGLAHTEQYIKIEPSRFDFGGHHYTKFLVSFSRDVDESEYCFNVSCGSTESIVPNSVGVVLDIDAYSLVERPLSAKFAPVWLGDLRNLKNSVFEEAITDKARSMFRVKNA